MVLRCRAYQGCWVGFKAIGETVESSASLYSHPARVEIVWPVDFEMPPGGLNIRWPDPRKRRPACSARPKPARLGIIATGKAYLDLRQTLADLGIAERDAQALGLRI